ncbi:MAG: hypothetical protein Q7R43_03380 [Candidatus Daviesbacteria bacterium]|nr:hypothetical protein [Candidatus Daviesbacteria bacterium]
MKKKLLIIVGLVLLTLPTVLPFFNSKFFYTQDYIFIARLNEISAALSDGSFPVRWAPDLRYGEPTFNYYAALPYYLGALIHLIGINFIWVAKILFILSSILSAISMFIFTKKLFGKKGAFLATALYVYAPYRAVDLYVRGALSEAWAFVFFPLIFYTALLLSEKLNLKRLAFLALSLSGLFLTHNVATIMFLPFFALFVLYLILKQRNWKLIFPVLSSLVLGLGLSAFFLLPAAFERDLIQTKYLIVGYFDFRAHFVAIPQFFSTFWGYGSSLWGPTDGLSFQIGLANLATLTLAVILGLIHRKDKKMLLLCGFLGLSFTLSLFLQHNRSAFIWEAIPLMAFIQFPWRFLAVSIFIAAVVGGAVTVYLTGKLRFVYVVLFILIVLSPILYFKPQKYVDDSFFEKFLDKEIMKKGVDLTKDYLPIWVQTTDAPPLNYPEAEKGRIEVLRFEKKTNLASAQINVLEGSVIEVPITYFPGWTVIANEKSLELENPSERGVIKFKLSTGSYDLRFEFRDTSVRMAGNYISIMSAAFLAAFLTLKFKNA